MQGQVTQPAEAINGDPLAGFDMGHFYRFIGGDPCAGDAAGCRRIKTIRHFDRVIGNDDTLFGHPAINGVARIFYRTAQRFVTAVTIFTVTAAFEEPCDAGAIARLERVHARADLLHHAHAFMAQNDAGFIAEIAVLNVQVGMADAAALHF